MTLTDDPQLDTAAVSSRSVVAESVAAYIRNHPIAAVETVGLLNDIALRLEGFARVIQACV